MRRTQFECDVCHTTEFAINSSPADWFTLELRSIALLGNDDSYIAIRDANPISNPYKGHLQGLFCPTCLSKIGLTAVNKKSVEISKPNVSVEQELIEVLTRFVEVIGENQS